MPRRILASLAVVACSLSIAAAASARVEGGSISLVAYSTPRAAYADLIPAFQKTAPGKGTSIQQSYGASGEQARAVVSGLKADVVALSLEPDVTTLVNKGIVPSKWKNDKWGGIVTRSVVVFAVRKGNPKKIRDWEDLVKPGVGIVTPNVQTSGGAKWNIMAAYGAQLRKKKTHAQAVAYLRNLYTHIVSQDKSAREALQTFLAGRGEVLLAYENEVIFANQNNQELPFVIPKATIRIENPIAVTATSENKATANAFLRYLRTTAAQKIFAENGYRPVVPAAAKGFSFPVRPQLFSIKWLGGWAKVDNRFFNPNSGIVTKIQREVGTN
ncbi:MAG TPA: sulfate ABC transporter substrate-binding protein [Gaiellaceae bacterium]|nr:sulfate ABC transporter substrate-binding protein [Gaiellaceae bacterium]